MELINKDKDDYKKTISKYSKSVLEENVFLYLLLKTLQKYEKRKETVKDVLELLELKIQIDKTLILIHQTTKEISSLTHKWSFLVEHHSLFYKASKQTKRVLSFMEDNSRIRKLCSIIFSLFDESPNLLSKINVKEFIEYIGEYFEKPEEFMSPKEYLKGL